MNEKIKDGMEKINLSSLRIMGCAQSLQFILKDLEAMETAATMYSEYDYRGLSNIVEQMADKIFTEAGKVMNLSDFVNFKKLYYDEVDSETNML